MKILTLNKNSHTSFSLLAGINRPINPAHVTKIANSIAKLGMLAPIVIAELSFIDGVKRKYIIDGQHKFNACLRNNIDIPYVVIQISDKEELVDKIALLNASSKNWCLEDYITSWSYINPDYKKLREYFNIYDIEICLLAAILSGDKATGGGGGEKIKKGKFKMGEEETNVKILDNVTDMLKIVPRTDRWSSRHAIQEYITFYQTTPSYNHKKFLTNLEKNKTDFVLATQE